MIGGQNNHGNRGPTRRQRHPGKHPGRNQYAYLGIPTNKQLHQETTAATNLAYRPTERSIAAERRASVQRTKNLGDWWNEYLAQVSGAQQATQGAYAQAAQQAQGLINTGSAVDTANTARLNQEASQAAAARGQSADLANAATTQTANMALSQRNTQLGAIGAATASRGANQYAYLADKRRIGAGQRVASMAEQAKKTASIEQDRTSLKKERGEYATKTLGSLQDKNRELQLKRQAFNLEKQSAAQSAKAEAAKQNREYKEFLAEQHHDEREAGINEREAGTNEKKARREQYEANHPGKSGPTPSERRDMQQGRRNAIVTAKNLYKAAKKPPQTGAQWAAFTQLVAAESEISPQEAQWAVKRLRQRVETRGRQQRRRHFEENYPHR